jgi:hypothetical protein
MIVLRSRRTFLCNEKKCRAQVLLMEIWRSAPCSEKRRLIPVMVSQSPVFPDLARDSVVCQYRHVPGHVRHLLAIRPGRQANGVWLVVTRRVGHLGS